MSAQLLLLTGKGGVGKTTVALAIAAHAARAGGRPLVVSLGGQARLPAPFDSEREVGHEPRAIGHGVAAMALDDDRAVVDYLAAHLRVRSLARALSRTRALSSFLRAAPAVAEIATLHALEALFEAGRWDPVIVDLDATGHARMLLELPRALDGLLGKDGPLHGLVGRATATLSDGARAKLLVVTLAEELPVDETEELVRWLRGEGSVALGGIVVSRAPSPPLSSGAVVALDAIERAARDSGDTESEADLALARRDVDAHVRAESHLVRLSALALPVVRLPNAELLSADTLAELGARIAGAVA